MKLWEKIKAFFRKRKKKKQIKQLPSGEKADEKPVLTEEEMHRIYQNIKQGKQRISYLTEEQLQSVILMLKEEKRKKAEKLEQAKAEVHAVQQANKEQEKQRLLTMYKGIQNNTLDLHSISKKDLEKMSILLQADYQTQKELLQKEQKKEENIRKEIKRLQTIT